MNFGEAIDNEMKWTETENGAVALNTTGSARLDLFAQAGSMRNLNDLDKCIKFDAAFNEDARDAVVLLFHTRNIRGGYGERDTFTTMLKHLANKDKDIIAKNLWAILEFGRAKDLYSLVGTKAEDDMWQFMKEQFFMDYANMKEGKSISLLAKWIASPASHSPKTKELGKLTAKKIGFDFKKLSEYKRMLSEMRKYLDVPEAKMASGRWEEIEYSKCASKSLLFHRKAFEKHDKERWDQYLNDVNNGKQNMNIGTVNPCEIFNKVVNNRYSSELDVMWKALPEICKEKVMPIIDTSGSMWWESSMSNGIHAGTVALSLGLYFAQHNDAELKNKCMLFSESPRYIKFNGSTLDQHWYTFRANSVAENTNLAAAFDLLLKTAVNARIPQESMPKAFMVISDMQIDKVEGAEDGRITFYDLMKEKYERAGYKLPQVIFWNVAVRKPTFLASQDDRGVSLVSGYSPSILKDVMNSIGSTPYELMRAVIDSEMYSKITV